MRHCVQSLARQPIAVGGSRATVRAVKFGCFEFKTPPAQGLRASTVDFIFAKTRLECCLPFRLCLNNSNFKTDRIDNIGFISIGDVNRSQIDAQAKTGPTSAVEDSASILHLEACLRLTLHIRSSIRHPPEQPHIMPITSNNKTVKLELPKSQASAEIYLYGATVTSWKAAGGSERLFLSSKAALDGSAAIRGGIPIVFPVFGPPSQHSDAPEVVKTLDKHGFARIHDWSLSTSVPTIDEEEVQCDARAAHQ